MKPLSPLAKILTVAFVTSGVIHLVRPQVFEDTIPPQLPAHRELVLVSGVAELAGAVGMWLPRTRRVAGMASALLLVAVFPANVQMTLDAAEAVQTKGSSPERIAWLSGTVARLPLQLPLIRAAWRAGR